MSTFISKQLREIEVEEAHGGSGARKLIFSDEEAVSSNLKAFTKGYLAPQSAFDWHSHEEIDEFFICEQGRGLLQLDTGEAFKYVPGSTYYIPSGLKHRIEAWGEDVSEFYFVRLRADRNSK